MNESNENQHPYSRLTPDLVLNAVDSSGHHSDGRLLALNSYENRVYQIGLNDNGFVIAKFYRPDRWADESILEEHDFTFELHDYGLPVLKPISDHAGNTLFSYQGFRFALYERCGGYAPILDLKDNRITLGRMLARIHALGATKTFKHRPTITIQEYVNQASTFLLTNCFIPEDLLTPYQSLINDLLPLIEHRFELAGHYQAIRLHGDCHVGNVLWTDHGPNFVDFDDTRMGPAIQDIWMFLPGGEQDSKLFLSDFLQGYEDFYNFDYAQIHLIEALRTMRIINYSAWLAKRWQDPAFPATFPWFNTVTYWQDHLLSLREQMAVLQEAENNLF